VKHLFGVSSRRAKHDSFVAQSSGLRASKYKIEYRNAYKEITIHRHTLVQISILLSMLLWEVPRVDAPTIIATEETFSNESKGRDVRYLAVLLRATFE